LVGKVHNICNILLSNYIFQTFPILYNSSETFNQQYCTVYTRLHLCCHLIIFKRKLPAGQAKTMEAKLQPSTTTAKPKKKSLGNLLVPIYRNSLRLAATSFSITSCCWKLGDNGNFSRNLHKHHSL